MKQCEICHCYFEESKSTQKYCKECGKDSNRARKKYEKATYVNKLNAGDLHKPKESTCLECGKKIVSIYEKRFCSIGCREYNQIKSATCPVCRVKLIDKGIESTRDKPCSEDCREAKRLKDAIANGNYVPCKTCKKPFIRKKITNEYCSTDCYKNREKPVVKIEKRPEKKEVPCQWCQKPFVWTKERASQKFCSVDCRTASSKKVVKADKDLHICTICKTSQADCERFQSNFVYSPKGAVMRKIGGKYLIVSCPKLKK